MKRLNKEFNIDINPNFKIKYGSTNHKKPEVIYIVGNTYISPSFDSNEYINDIDELKKLYITFVNKLITEYNNTFEKNCIFDVDICDNRIKKGKKTYFTFELLLKQKKLLPLSEIEEIIKNLSTKLLLKFVDTLSIKNFICFKSKKNISKA